jgi:hypothetical protein
MIRKAYATVNSLMNQQGRHKIGTSLGHRRAAVHQRGHGWHAHCCVFFIQEAFK